MLENSQNFEILSILVALDFFNNVGSQDVVSKNQYKSILKKVAPNGCDLSIVATKLLFHLSVYEHYEILKDGNYKYLFTQQIEIIEVSRGFYNKRFTYFVNKNRADVVG